MIRDYVYHIYYKEFIRKVDCEANVISLLRNLYENLKIIQQVKCSLYELQSLELTDFILTLITFSHF